MRPFLPPPEPARVYQDISTALQLLIKETDGVSLFNLRRPCEKRRAQMRNIELWAYRNPDQFEQLNKVALQKCHAMYAAHIERRSKNKKTEIENGETHTVYKY